MPRPPQPPHKLKLRNHHGRAVCTFRGKVYPFGAWDAKRDAPTPDALAAFQRQVGLWAVNPDAARDRVRGELLANVWGDWLASPHAPADRRDENARCELALFGVKGKPGPFAAVSSSDLTAADVLAWQDALCVKKLSRYTVKRYVSLLRSCLSWGCVAGRVPGDVVTSVGMVPPPPAGATKAAEVRQGAGVRDFAASVRRISGGAAVLLRVEWYTGARPDELCRLAVGDVQKAGTVRPAKGQGVDLGTHGLWAVVMDKHKTKNKGGERCLFFGPRCQRLLAPLLAGRPANAPLFPNRSGAGYNSKVINKAVKRASARAKVKRVTPYMIRHAIAERVQARFSGEIPGAGYLAAQAYLGHKIRGVTSGYTGADWVTAAKVAKLVG